MVLLHRLGLLLRQRLLQRRCQCLVYVCRYHLALIVVVHHQQVLALKAHPADAGNLLHRQAVLAALLGTVGRDLVVLLTIQAREGVHHFVMQRLQCLGQVRANGQRIGHDWLPGWLVLLVVLLHGLIQRVLGFGAYNAVYFEVMIVLESAYGVFGLRTEVAVD